MNIDTFVPTSQAAAKRLAKGLARELGIPHHQALDLAAKRAGFENWSHARKHLPEVGDRSTLSGRDNPIQPVIVFDPIDHADLFRRDEAGRPLPAYLVVSSDGRILTVPNKRIDSLADLEPESQSLFRLDPDVDAFDLFDYLHGPGLPLLIEEIATLNAGGIRPPGLTSTRQLAEGVLSVPRCELYDPEKQFFGNGESIDQYWWSGQDIDECVFVMERAVERDNPRAAPEGGIDAILDALLTHAARAIMDPAHAGSYRERDVEHLVRHRAISEEQLADWRERFLA